jgi:hypothetical protein
MFAPPCLIQGRKIDDIVIDKSAQTLVSKASPRRKRQQSHFELLPLGTFTISGNLGAT